MTDYPLRCHVSLGRGAEELEQQCIVGFDPCLRKAMTAMVEFDETRMCNLLGNQLAQLPWNEEIIRGSNQQRRVSDTPQAFSGIISEQRVDACRRDFLRRVPGRPAIKTYLLAQRLLAEHEQPAQSRVQPRPKLRRERGMRPGRNDRLPALAQWRRRSNVRRDAPGRDPGDL